jgi:hypothetical protein
MAEAEFTTNPRVSSVEFLHASGRAGADAKTDGEEERGLLSVFEEALEEERARLMLANSILGCVQLRSIRRPLQLCRRFTFRRCWSWHGSSSIRACRGSSTRRFGGCCTARWVALADNVPGGHGVVRDV